MVDYTILKQAGVSCGNPNDFRLKIQPGSGYQFQSLVVNETTGNYATKVTVTLSATSGGTVIQHLCNANVVCEPNEVPITILTLFPNLPDKEEKKAYQNAENG